MLLQGLLPFPFPDWRVPGIEDKISGERLALNSEPSGPALPMCSPVPVLWVEFGATEWGDSLGMVGWALL